MHTWQPANPLLLHPVGTAKPRPEVRTIRLWIVALVVVAVLAAGVPSLLVGWALRDRPAPPGPAACRSAAEGGEISYRSRTAAIEALADCP